MSTEPKVGDKVVYVPMPEHRSLSAAGPWLRRQHEPSQVVDGPLGVEGRIRCWTPGDSDYWTAWPGEYRVVERATYERVGEP
jgi:hypothetical protein